MAQNLFACFLAWRGVALRPRERERERVSEVVFQSPTGRCRSFLHPGPKLRVWLKTKERRADRRFCFVPENQDEAFWYMEPQPFGCVLKQGTKTVAGFL